MNIASCIDHSFLSPIATVAEIEKTCIEAREYGFRAVCVPPLFVSKVKGFLEGSNVRLATVTGFPFGYSAVEAKLAETVLAIVDGADEIDMVINIAALKNADWQYLAKEVNSIFPVIKSKGKAMKLILETAFLNETEIMTCCDIFGAAGVDWIKTSTGCRQEVVKAETIGLLRKHLADAVRINAGIAEMNYAEARKLLDAGASVVSPINSIQIVKEAAVLN